MPYIAKTHNRYQRILKILLDAQDFLTAKEVRDRLSKHGQKLSEEQVKRILKGFESIHDLDSRPRNTLRGRPPTEYSLAPTKAPQGSVHVAAEQALTLGLTAELLGQLLPNPLLAPLKVELELAQSLIEREIPSMRPLPNKIVLVPRGVARTARKMDAKNLATIYQALLAERRLDVGYSAVYDGQKPPETYEISPLGLIFRIDTLYLVLVKEPIKGTKPPRIFEWPVQRFSRVDITKKPIRQLPDFDLKKHAEQAGCLSNFHDHPLKDLGLKFKLTLKVRHTTATYMDERRFGKDQRIAPPRNGWCRLTATVPNTRDLLSELYDFADDIIVIKPEPLREYMAERARAVTRHYEP